MKNLEPNKRTSASFLERFEGKRTAISKEGLIHLFEQHQKKIVALPLGLPPEPRKIHIDSSSRELLTERSRELQRLGSDLRAPKDPGSRLSYRTEVLRETGKDDLVLPRIAARFSSSHQKLLPRNEEGRKMYLNLEKPPKKTLAGGSKHMDENALEHLEFLNKL
jgi:hypothetical protein